LLLRKIEWLPEEIRHRLDSNLAANRERNQRIRAAFEEASAALRDAKVKFIVLKGFANWERFAADPELRLQYDLDLYCPDSPVLAREALIENLGYTPISDTEEFTIDHLPALIRKTGWQWRGDFFDPEIPVSIEVHFRLWDEATEMFPAPCLDAFWSRRVAGKARGLPWFAALDPGDALCSNALHFLRHLLRGDVRAANLYELGYFLHVNAEDDGVWTRWSALHPPELRRLQAVCFRLAAAWFDCRLSAAVREEIDRLPAPIARWFEHCAASPVEAFFRPNKDELWLHLCLLDSFKKKSAILRRRLLPARLPGPLDSVFIPEERLNRRTRMRKRWEYVRYVAGRGVYHARAMLPTLSRMLTTRS